MSHDARAEKSQARPHARRRPTRAKRQLRRNTTRTRRPMAGEMTREALYVEHTRESNTALAGARETTRKPRPMHPEARAEESRAHARRRTTRANRQLRRNATRTRRPMAGKITRESPYVEHTRESSQVLEPNSFAYVKFQATTAGGNRIPWIFGRDAAVFGWFGHAERGHCHHTQVVVSYARLCYTMP